MCFLNLPTSNQRIVGGILRGCASKISMFQAYLGELALCTQFFIQQQKMATPVLLLPSAMDPEFNEANCHSDIIPSPFHVPIDGC